MRWIAVNYLFSPRSQYSYEKDSSPHGIEPLPSCMPSPAYSTAPTVTYLFAIYSEFKSGWVNVGKQMRWIFVRNAVIFAVNFCKKCGEMRWNIFFHRIHRFHRFHRNSYINLTQKPMRWIFVRNAVNFAVNFCKKCGEIFILTAFTAITAFLTKVHRIHRNFLQKFTQKPRPGYLSAIVNVTPVNLLKRSQPVIPKKYWFKINTYLFLRKILFML